MEKNPSSSSRNDRKTIERNRRSQMKDLYSKLNSLVPHQHSEEAISLPDQLDEAAKYIKKTQIKLEKMKEKKDSLMAIKNPYPNMDNGVNLRSKSPEIEISLKEKALEVVLITGFDSQFIFNQIITILHQENAEIVSASLSTLNDTVFHTIHSQIGDFPSGDGDGAARLIGRLKKFVHDCNQF